MLSTRGHKNANSDAMAAYRAKSKDPYHKITNPTGEVNFGNAVNYLMHDEMMSFINEQKNWIEPSHLSYNNGPAGSWLLRDAMAMHINETFHPAFEVTNQHITFGPGVTALNEMLVKNLADEREAWLLGMPCYGQFNIDLKMTTGCEIVHVPFGEVGQFGDGAVEKYENALKKARGKGVVVKGLVICNPHNPLGRCYPIDTLKALLKFCDRHKLHLISDEIYALSVFETKDEVQPAPFTSVLSIDLEGLIDMNYVHALYGMSKDFGAAGLRLGCLITRNDELSEATRAICRFHWPSEFSSAITIRILEDRAFTKSFLKKNSQLLSEYYALATSILDHAGIRYYKGGNAGLFIWVDLSPYLGTPSAEKDRWAMEKELSEKLERAGVLMSRGEAYHCEKPGWFRLIFSRERGFLEEGLRRVVEVVKGT